MFVCVVSLSQSSSRDLLYVKCLCVLSRYLSPVVEISYHVCFICYMLNVCVLLSVKCLCVVCYMLKFVCVVSVISVQ